MNYELSLCTIYFLKVSFRTFPKYTFWELDNVKTVSGKLCALPWMPLVENKTENSKERRIYKTIYGAPWIVIVSQFQNI
jgi:hypothetical protein